MKNTDMTIKRFRIAIANMQSFCRRRKRIINDADAQRDRMNVGNIYTDYGNGYRAGYHAAMNDMLKFLANDINYADTVWYDFIKCRKDTPNDTDKN